jgi:signal peptidase I
MTLLSTIWANTTCAFRTRCNSKLYSNFRSPTTSMSFTTTSTVTTTTASIIRKTTSKRQTFYHHLDRRCLTTSAQLPPKNDESVVSWSSMLLEIVAGYCLAILVVPVYILDVMKCDGPSMYPLFHHKGDIIVVEKLTHRWYGIQDGDKGQVRACNLRKRQQEQSTTQSNNITAIHGLTYGDVVVVEHPLREGTVCKRIVALPGDQVIVPRRPEPTTVRVPDGHVWLEGDNKDNSTDSRSYGPVPAPLIVGVVRLRVWPVRGEALLKRRCPDGRNPLVENHSSSTENTIVIPAGSS